MNGIGLYERNIQQGSSDEKVIHISYSNFSPGDYEKQVIFGNRCPSLVRMRCIFEGSRADIFYITGGSYRYKEYIERKAVDTQDILRVILAILKALQDCCGYLIMENEISLNSNNIFFSLSDDSVRLMYMPGRDQGMELSEQMILLTREAEAASRLGMLQKDILRGFCDTVSDCGNDISKMIEAAEEALRKTYIPFQDISDEADVSVPKLQEEKRDYSEAGSFKRHLKDFFNELVS